MFGNQRGVVLSRRGGEEDGGSGDSRISSEQRDQSLMLDLLKPREREEWPGVPVPEKTPCFGKELGVPSIPPVHLDEKRATVEVLTEKRTRPPALDRCRGEMSYVEPRAARSACKRDRRG